MKPLIANQLSAVDWKPGRSYLDQKVLHANLPSQKNINLIHINDGESNYLCLAGKKKAKKDDFEFKRQGLLEVLLPGAPWLPPPPPWLPLPDHWVLLPPKLCRNEHINFFYCTSSPTFLSANLVVANTDIKSNFLESNQDSSLQSSFKTEVKRLKHVD